MLQHYYIEKRQKTREQLTKVVITTVKWNFQNKEVYAIETLGGEAGKILNKRNKNIIDMQS